MMRAVYFLRSLGGWLFTFVAAAILMAVCGAISKSLLVSIGLEPGPIVAAVCGIVAVLLALRDSKAEAIEADRVREIDNSELAHALRGEKR